jgi:membrane protein YdbS with pleckstrin-like domain
MPTVAEEVERYIEQGYFPEDVTPTRATLSRKPRFPWSMFVRLTVLFGLLSTAGLVAAWIADPSSSLLVSLLFIWGVTAVLFIFVSGWYWAGQVRTRVHLYQRANGEILVREEELGLHRGNVVPMSRRGREYTKKR